jgi:ADP-heptose:LPS heptosyltransferase
MQSIGKLLDTVPDPRLKNSVRLLRNLTPQNLREYAERLQLSLFPYIQSQVPRDYIVTANPPPAQFIQEPKKILLLSGPAIGIGDEVITFPTPAWIKAHNPAAEITVLSAYKGLWERVSGVDRVHQYEDYHTIILAIRGELDLGAFDLVMLVDFEYPELYQAVISEGLIPRYIELSLGAQMLAAVDNNRRWIYRLHQPVSYFKNFYYGYSNLIQGLGLSPLMKDRFSNIVTRSQWPADDELRIFVSPFTSKYDPSPLYWSRLLASLITSPPQRPVRVLLDPGPNLTTMRFAEELSRSAGARAPSRVSFEVAQSVDGPGLPLAGVFAELERTHVVICSDSFITHIAPTLGCTTMVLASRGLEDWRVPAPRNFYLNAEDPPEEIIGAMKQILSHFDLDPFQENRRPPISEAEKQLMAMALDSEGHLVDNEKDGYAKRIETYTDFLENQRKVIARLPYWPQGTKGLLRDFAYEDSPRNLSEIQQITKEFQEDISVYITHNSQEWQNTNLFKYLSLVMGEAPA